MARFTKIKVYQNIENTVIVPVFYHPDPEIAKHVVEACYQGGIRVFEFTNRGEYAHEIFEELNKWAVTECPGLILGAGSVIDASTASLYIQLGANFVVSPLLNPDIFKICNRRQIAYIPGCATASEIGYAQELGAYLVKIFPGDVLGPDFVKSIKAPMPWTNIMVTGGVTPNEENLTKWLDAGTMSVGIGSNLFPKEIIESCNWDEISERCKKVLSIVKK